MEGGSCSCGAVTIQVEGLPENVRVCHCRLCQKTMGSPYFARALFAQEKILITGTPTKHPSSDRLDRVFCSKCGTTLGAWRKDNLFAGIALAIFDNRNAFKPTEHIWVSEKLEWVEMPDGVMQYPKGKTQ